MNTLRIKKVEGKSEISAFHRLPFLIYKNDARWIPHIRQEVEGIFDPKQNKHFTHGECQRWILLRDDLVIGRIAAFINRRKAHSFKQPTGGLGFFECIENFEAASLLFDTAKEWLMARGMEAMDGPINFGENNKYWGLIVENYELPTYHGQNYNPPYYKSFFERYGFQVYYYQLINYRKLNDVVPEKFREKAKFILQDKNFDIQHIKTDRIEKYAEDFRIVYNAAWVTHDGFKEMAREVALSIFKKMKRIIDERLVCFAYYQQRPVAFCLCIPDLNQIFRKLNGNLNLLGKVKFILFKSLTKITRINGVAIGVHPEFQKRGLEGALFSDLANRLQGKTSYQDIVVTWVGDFNPKMQHICEEVGFRVRVKMATYRILFDPAKTFERSPIIHQ